MLTLHYAPDNASLVVRLALEELQLPYRAVLVDRAAQEQRGAAFRRLNPQGLIPVLETPDGALFETGAILLWLADRHHALAPPPDSPARGHFLKWLFFVAGTLHGDLRQQFHPERYATDIAAHHALTRARLGGHFALLDELAADAPGWFAAPAPTVLDFYAGVAMRWAALYVAGQPRWFHSGDYPALQRMAQRLELRPTALAAARSEGLGPAPFSDPQLPLPPAGSPT